ncbi:MAG: amidohydrolase family protein [Novosphingobium sp.]|nr:amidohydrolase family protein [Novosphingobium sp.]
MATTLIAGGQVVDGTGREPVRADVLVEGERIVRVGSDLSARDADQTIDAGGCVVAPGFIDIHSHYDAQIFWEHELSSSCHHGVTTVINGNCGFAIAPYSRDTRGLVIEMLRDQEDMHPDVLEAALPPDLESFERYLGEVEKRGPMLNFGGFVGHSTIRIMAMGPDAFEREATPEEIAAMARLADAGLKAGAMGIATKTLPRAARTASQQATEEEVMTLLEVLRDHGRGVAMFNAGGCFDLEKVHATQQQIGRPFTWIALLAMPSGHHLQFLELHNHWRERGADVRPQVSCRPLIARNRMSMPSIMRSPLMAELNPVSEEQRIAAYADSAWRDRMRPELRSNTGERIDWNHVTLDQSASSPELQGGTLAAIGRERGVNPLDALLDLAVADRLATSFIFTYGNDDPDEVARLLNVEGAVLGLSDAGAHPEQICDAVLPSDLLGNWVRGRGALSLEAAVHKLTQEPAQLMGIGDRGQIAKGCFADITIFDPATIGPGEVRTVNDLPTGRERLLADRPAGIHHMLVNGTMIRKDQRTTPAHCGKIIRPQ